MKQVADTYLRLIPVGPSWVPAALARERALRALRRAAPFADDVANQVPLEVRFIDCGANVETVRCPLLRDD